MVFERNIVYFDILNIVEKFSLQLLLLASLRKPILDKNDSFILFETNILITVYCLIVRFEPAKVTLVILTWGYYIVVI